MSGQPEGTLRLAEAAKQCGVTVDVMKRLIQTGHLHGTIRSGNGHVYLREDAVPEWCDVVELLEHRLRHHIAQAEKSLARVRAELDAVGMDLEVLREHVLDELGFDATHFAAMPSSNHHGTFGDALCRLQMDLFEVRLYSDALRDSHRVV